MAIQFVKTIGTASATTAGTTLTVTVPAGGVAAGNFLVARVTHLWTSSGATATDTRGNTWTRDRTAPSTNSVLRASLLTAPIITALQPGDTITITTAGSIADRAVAIDEFSGIAALSPLDFSDGAASASSATPSIGAANTTPNALIIGFVGVNGPNTDTFIEADAFTGLTRIGTNTTTPVTVNSAFRVVSTAGTIAYSPTLGTARNWVAMMAGYKAADSPPAAGAASGTWSFGGTAVGVSPSVVPATGMFYLANAASDINPPISSWWEDATNGATALALTTVPTGTNVASTRAETSTSASFDVLLGRWVSPPILQAGTLDASGTVVDLVWAVQAAATSDFRTSYTIRVVTSAGADRGYLLTNSGQNGIAGGTAWGTTLTGKQENTPSSLATSVTVQPGDRVVVELGYRPQNTTATSRSGTMRYGGTATTDLVAGDTGTDATTRPAWIRFTGPNVSNLWTPPTIPSGAGSGVWTFAGSAAGKRAPQGIGAGTVTFAGAVAGRADRRGAASAGWAFTGSAVGRVSRAGAALGSWAFTGSVAGKASPVGTATGTWTFTGTATGAAPRRGSATGTWGFPAPGGFGTAPFGTAPYGQGAANAVGVTPRDGTADSTIMWAGAAQGYTTRRGAATGGWSTTSAATGASTRHATASGGWAFTGTGQGRTARNAVSAGTFAFTGAAVGDAPDVPTKTGVASGTVKWAGVALAGNARAGAASGAWAFTGVAAGHSSRLGSAGGTYQYVGTASGSAIRSSAAVGVWAFAGAAAGRAPKSGAASGLWAYAGIAYSSSSPLGSAAGWWGFVGSAAAAAARRGASDGVWAWQGAASGPDPTVGPRVGEAAGTWSFTGVGHGPTTGGLGPLHAGHPRPGGGLHAGRVVRVPTVPVGSI